MAKANGTGKFIAGVLAGALGSFLGGLLLQSIQKQASQQQALQVKK